MEVYYEGVDITEMVQTRKCVVHDQVGGRSDSLEIEFENAAGWYRWGPQEDDQIVVSHNGYDTGVMFLNTVLPEDGRFRILATSLPCKARKKEYRSFSGKTLDDIMRSCAIADGMDYGIYGMARETVIPYIQRENESSAAFLHRLIKLEGGRLKCVNGRYTAIGIEYAQARKATQAIEVYASQTSVQYRRNGQKLYALTVETPYACATARDLNVSEDHQRIIVNHYPARSEAQAGRWARALLMQTNQQCESLWISSEYNAGFAPMMRIDIDGDTDANGEWLIEEVEHDFIDLSSNVLLRRCIRTIL